MVYKRRTKDVWVLQVKYCEMYGYEDIAEEDVYQEIKRRKREYIENSVCDPPAFPCRIVMRRVPLARTTKTA